MSNDRRKNLETIALFASSSIRNALEAAAITLAADAFFSKYGETTFLTNPANTLPYSALRALEGQAVLSLAEILKDEHKLYPLDVDLRAERDLLVSHRDMIGHPMTVKWRTTERGDCAKDVGRRHSRIRAGLVWRVANALDDALTKQGASHGGGPLAQVPVHRAMATMLYSIFCLSMRAEARIPTENVLLAYLSTQEGSLRELLELFPDGVAVQP